MTWKYGILHVLHEASIRGRLLDYILFYILFVFYLFFLFKIFNERCFCVHAGSCLSDFYNQKMGVMQGAILSVLFILKIKSVIKFLPVGVRGSLYIDDFCIRFRSKSLIALNVTFSGVSIVFKSGAIRMDLNSENSKQFACIFLNSTW